MYYLRKEIRAALIDPNNKRAFDLLLEEVRGPEMAAMVTSTLPTIIDKLSVMAGINARKLVDVLADQT